MNAAIVRRLMWKEYRFLRSFWLATLFLAACAAVGWCGLASWYQQTVKVEDFILLAAVVTSMFALGAGGTMFATEYELGTVEFLRRLPLDARHLLCGKLVLSAASVLALKSVLWNAACLSSIWFPWRGSSLSTIWWCSLVSDLELFAWGLLFSLLTRQPLMAITWAVTVASAIVHMVLPFFWPMTRYDAQYVRGGLLTDYDYALLGRTSTALLLLACVAWLSTIWTRSPQPLSIVPEGLARWFSQGRGNSARWLTAPRAQSPATSSVRVQLLRLIWLQWRQSRWWWASLALPSIVTGVWKMASTSRQDDVDFVFSVSTGLLWFGMGLGTFYGQQSRNRFRYFAERGIAPGRVWWAVQLGALAPMTASVALTVVTGIMGRDFPVARMSHVFELASMFLLVSSIIFSVGQLVGLLIRQILVAVAIGIVALVIHVLWFRLLDLGVGIKPSGELLALFGLVPLPLVWWRISRWQVEHWILERHTWRNRLRLSAALVAPWLVLLVGLMAYRVLEVPNVGIEPPTHRQLMTLTAEERATAMRYQEVVNSFGVSAGFWDSSFTTRETKESIIAQRLQESNQTLDKLLEATQRRTGALAGDPPAQNATGLLLTWVLETARKQAADAGSLERSVELHDAQRRLIHHWRRNADFTGLAACNRHESQLAESLLQQLKSSTWRAEQYRGLAGRVAAWSEQERPTDRALEWAHRAALDHLAHGTNALFVDHGEAWEPSGNTYPAPTPWLLWIPGERARAARLIKANFAVSRSGPTIGQGAMSRRIPALEWNTPWALWLLHEYQDQSPGHWHVLPARNWRILRAWLEVRARHAELQHWPETTDGISGLGAIKTENPYLIETLQYLPDGLWGGRAPEPLVVREFGARRLARLNGYEPCLVILSRNKTPNLPDDLVRIRDQRDREEMLHGLTVIPFAIPTAPQSSDRED